MYIFARVFVMKIEKISLYLFEKLSWKLLHVINSCETAAESDKTSKYIILFF